MVWPFRRKRTNFAFQPRWKEELVVTGPGGSLVRYFPMGVPAAVLPSEERWASVAPDWASGRWPLLKDELEHWCRKEGVHFEIDPQASVY